MTIPDSRHILVCGPFPGHWPLLLDSVLPGLLNLDIHSLGLPSSDIVALQRQYLCRRSLFLRRALHGLTPAAGRLGGEGLRTAGLYRRGHGAATTVFVLYVVLLLLAGRVLPSADRLSLGSDGKNCDGAFHWQILSLFILSFIFKF